MSAIVIVLFENDAEGQEGITDFIANNNINASVATREFDRQPFASIEWWLPPVIGVSVLIFNGFFTRLGELAAEKTVGLIKFLGKKAISSQRRYVKASDVDKAGNIIGQGRLPPLLTISVVRQFESVKIRFRFVYPRGLREEDFSAATQLLLSNISRMEAESYKMKPENVSEFSAMYVYDVENNCWREAMSLLRARLSRE